MKRTRSDPIQFRLDLADYDVLQLLADKEGLTPKDFVVALTMCMINANRHLVPADYPEEP